MEINPVKMKPSKKSNNASFREVAGYHILGGVLPNPYVRLVCLKDLGEKEESKRNLAPGVKSSSKNAVKVHDYQKQDAPKKSKRNSATELSAFRRKLSEKYSHLKRRQCIRTKVISTSASIPKRVKENRSVQKVSVSPKLTVKSTSVPKRIEVKENRSVKKVSFSPTLMVQNAKDVKWYFRNDESETGPKVRIRLLSPEEVAALEAKKRDKIMCKEVPKVIIRMVKSAVERNSEAKENSAPEQSTGSGKAPCGHIVCNVRRIKHAESKDALLPDIVQKNDSSQKPNSTQEDNLMQEDNLPQKDEMMQTDDSTLKDDSMPKGDSIQLVQVDDSTQNDNSTTPKGNLACDDDSIYKDDLTLKDNSTHNDNSTDKDDLTLKDNSTRNDNSTDKDDLTLKDNSTRNDNSTDKDDLTLKDNSTRNDNSTDKDDLTHQEGSTHREDSTYKDDTTHKDDSINKDHSAQKDDSAHKEDNITSPH